MMGRGAAFLKTTVAAFLIVGLGQISAAETLTDALIGAYRTSGLLEQQRAVLRATDEDVAQAAATLRPALDYAARSTWSEGGQNDGLYSNLSVSLGMLLYDFGGSKLAVEASKETVLATREALRGVEQNVLLRAVVAFTGVRRAEAFVGLNQNNVRVITQQVRASRDRFDVGEVTRTDVSIAEARLAAANAGLAAQQGALVRAREEYKAAVGHYPGPLVAPRNVPATAASLDAARAISRQSHPEMLQVQHQVAASELAIEIARTQMLPKLSAQATAGLSDGGNNANSVSVTLGGPIYSGGAIASGVRQAQAGRDRTRALLLTTSRGVDQNVGNAWANRRVADASLQATNRQVEAAQLALNGLREELQLGARTTLEVLDQEQELLDAQTNRVSAANDRIDATYQLLAAMGLLTAQHLGLPVPNYDPAAYYNAVQGAPVRNVSPQGEKLDHILRKLGK